ncbi:hypothetical protein FMIA91_21730 [Fidelibacter multiformis]
MIQKQKKSFFIMVIMIILSLSSCERDITGLDPAPFPDDPEVFMDEFGEGIQYQAFLNSKYDALEMDAIEYYDGDRSMSFIVPDANDPSGWFAGGALVHPVGRDLTQYDALTFWTKASMPAEVGVFGFGNDNSGTSKYTVEMPDVTVNTLWKKVILPIPLASKLTREGGMFHLAASHVNGHGYKIWVDEVRFEHLGTIAHPRPVINNQTITGEVGDSLTHFSGTRVTMNVAGNDVTVNMSSHYLTFISSNDTIVSVDEEGIIRLVGPGTAVLSAKLGSVDAEGSVTIISKTPPPAPETSAPTPTFASEDVISLFCDEYPNVSIDTWSAEWDAANVEDYTIGSDTLKKYYNLQFAGIEFTSSPIDASDMTHFHLDMWTPNSTSPPALFKIKLVDFGADGVFGGGDDSEHELTFSAGTNPALATESWVRFDIPLSQFTGMTGKNHIAQLIISGNPNIVYIDNILFHK